MTNFLIECMFFTFYVDLEVPSALAHSPSQSPGLEETSQTFHPSFFVMLHVVVTFLESSSGLGQDLTFPVHDGVVVVLGLARAGNISRLRISLGLEFPPRPRL